jgi:2-polyprenyl-3-methyl-5-hydroxy-6-metoxy-1,4-benzoquinol methylase
MHLILDRMLARIETADPIYGKQLRKRLSAMDEHYVQTASDYFGRYDAALRLEGKSIGFGVDCYLKLSSDMTTERINFVRTGKYANSSYKEVQQRIYGNAAIMDYHMHGLAIAQYLWPEQYARIEFFQKNLPIFTGTCTAYLEVGGGHGLYVWTALQKLPENTRFDLLDISPSSIELAEKIVGPSRVNYVLMDIFEYEASQPYDFITAGEIIEHLENPLAFLQKISSLLNPGGTIYFTTSINAPMIDHIYLFSDAQEIRELIAAAGLKIVTEKSVPSRDLPEHLIVQHKVPVMYAAFLRRG